MSLMHIYELRAKIRATKNDSIMFISCEIYVFLGQDEDKGIVGSSDN